MAAIRTAHRVGVHEERCALALGEALVGGHGDVESVDSLDEEMLALNEFLLDTGRGNEYVIAVFDADAAARARHPSERIKLPEQLGNERTRMVVLKGDRGGDVGVEAKKGLRGRS